MKELIGTGLAFGKDRHGDTRVFEIVDGELNCYNKELIDLYIPKGVTHVYCYSNKLTELILPEGVEEVYCYGNQITELKLPEGVMSVSCENNQISHLDLPESVTELWCDKRVTGLERHVGKTHMRLK